MSQATSQKAAIREPDFLAIISTYNEATERLKQSHEALGREVCRLREELQDKSRQLHRKERLAALGEMAAGVAHEVRNPLGAIRLYASLLKRDLADRPEQLDLVRSLETGVRNIDGIVGDILAFAGEMEPHPRPVGLAEILESVLAQAWPRAGRRHRSVEVDAAAKQVTLYCDPGQIGRALLNLIANALDAVPEDGHVWVQIGPLSGPGHDLDDGLCHICVEDNGPGMEPGLLQRVFNPFFTTKDTGTGLGLSIVHRIAEANGGCVRAGNRKGGGAVFVLSVPAVLTPANNIPAGKEVSQPTRRGQAVPVA